MWPFPISYGISYILLAIDYVLRWVEAKSTKTNEAKVVMKLLKSNIFCRSKKELEVVKVYKECLDQTKLTMQDQIHGRPQRRTGSHPELDPSRLQKANSTKSKD
ncbi:hypothetical protein CR513_12329, partial [Mucuna pruriens]